MIPNILMLEPWRPRGSVCRDWDDALKFFAKLRTATEMRFAGTDIPFVDCVTIKRPTGEIVELTYAVYYKSDESWLQETTPALMQAAAVPEKILTKPDGAEEEVDITDFIENEWEVSK